MGGIVFALLAALCNAVSVIERHIASTADPDRPHGRQLAGYLLRNPRWLTGWAAQIGAFAFQAVALHLSPVSVVQPLLVTELVIALVLRRLWIRQSVSVFLSVWLFGEQFLMSAGVLAAAAAGFAVMAAGVVALSLAAPDTLEADTGRVASARTRSG